METNLKESMPKWIWQAIGVLVVILLALVVLDKIHVVQEDFKSTIPKNTISMSAEGKLSAVPDLASVSIGVLTTAATAKQAQADNTTKANAVIEYIKQQGVDAKSITTTDLSVNPQYDYSSSVQKIIGYQANQTVNVKVHGVDKSTEVLNKVIGGATNAGANQINNVSLSFENPDDLRQQARKLAVDKAKQQAKELADQAGLKLGRVVNISESSNQMPYPMPYALDSAAGKGGGPITVPSVQTGSQDITESITLTFEIK